MLVSLSVSINIAACGSADASVIIRLPLTSSSQLPLASQVILVDGGCCVVDFVEAVGGV